MRLSVSTNMFYMENRGKLTSHIVNEINNYGKIFKVFDKINHSGLRRLASILLSRKGPRPEPKQGDTSTMSNNKQHCTSNSQSSTSMFESPGPANVCNAKPYNAGNPNCLSMVGTQRLPTLETQSLVMPTSLTNVANPKPAYVPVDLSRVSGIRGPTMCLQHPPATFAAATLRVFSIRSRISRRSLSSSLSSSCPSDGHGVVRLPHLCPQRFERELGKDGLDV